MTSTDRRSASTRSTHADAAGIALVTRLADGLRRGSLELGFPDGTRRTYRGPEPASDTDTFGGPQPG